MSKRSERILKAIEDSKLSYGELSNITGIPKSALQRYATGETEKVPIDRIESIARATHVTAMYLMGWESQEEKQHIDNMLDDMKEHVYGLMSNGFSDIEIDHMRHFDALNHTNKQKVISYTDNLLKVQQIEEDQLFLMPQAAHERTDIEVTDEMRKHDDDIMDNDDFWK